MIRCLSSEQFDDLVEGRLESPDVEASEAHLEACPTCRLQFTEHTRIPDEDGWRRAAWEAPPADDSELALLAELKKFDGQLPAERVGRAIDNADLLDGDDDSVVQIRPDLPVGKPRGGRWPTVPGFEILGELGRGGMGVVYKARQAAHDRVVALKMILSGQAASQEDLGRFHDEAEAVSRLRHPHIVQIFEVGQVEDRLYFVLEFVEGGTLADKIQTKAMPVRSSAQLMESLARAMHYAHQRGIIHRDLKPANVLLHGRKAFLDIPEDVDRQPEEWDFRRFMPKITDFGLAKLMDRGGSGHTASGDVVGTPSYMAPEQAQGKPQAISPTTDVYSLGAILYEMLTGRPPFHGATPMDTLFQVHTQEPIAPRKIVREIPAALETICLKCLRKDPNARYKNAEGMADDLRLFLDGQPIQTRAGRAFRVPKVSRRMGSWLLVAGVFALATAAGGVLVSNWLHNTSESGTTTTSRDDANTASAETVRLRLRLAQANCERGETAQGLFEMAALLDAAERDSPAAEHRTARLNLAAWGRMLPELQWVSPTPVPAAAFAPLAGELYVVGPDRRLLMTGPRGDALAVDIPDGLGLQSLTVSVYGPTLAAIAPDGLRWYNVGENKLLAHVTTLPNPERPELSPDGSTLLVKSPRDDNALWLVRPAGPAKPLIIEPLGVPGNPTAWGWNPRGGQIVVGFADGNVEIKDLDPSHAPPPRSRQPAAVSGVAWVNDGATTAVACADGCVRFRNAPGSRAVEPSMIRAHAPGPVQIATHRNGLLLTAGADRFVKLWRVATGELLATLPHPVPAPKVAFHGDGTAFLTHDARGTVRVWGLPPGNDGLPLPGRSAALPDRLVLFGVEFEPGFKVIRSVDERHRLRRWDANSGKELEPPLPPPSQSWPVASDAAGDRWLALGADGAVRLSMPTADRYEPLLPAPPTEFRGAGFSPDGRLLVVAGAEGVRLYDAMTALAIGPVLALSNLKGVRFSDDGKQILAWSATEARSWPLPGLSTSNGAAWRQWLRRRTGVDRAPDGTLHFLNGPEWKSSGNDAR